MDDLEGPMKTLPNEDENVYVFIDPLLLKGSVVSSSDDSAFIHFSNNERFGNSFSLSSGLVFPIADKKYNDI